MAKRKSRGASFAKSRNTVAEEKMEGKRRQQGLMYTAIGIGAFLLLCFVVWLLFRPSDSSETVEETGSSEIEDSGSADTLEEGSGEEYVAVVGDEEEAGTELSDAVASDFVRTGDYLDGPYILSDTDPAERDGYYDAYPEMILEEGNYQAEIVTENGVILVQLYDDETPLTVNNFVYLATDGFYDNTTFHRVLEGFMAQAGDPSATGRGGPGYRFEDEVDTPFSFNRAGLLAMANSGPATNGSQFFITYGPTEWLDGNHTIFGEVIEGYDVLESIRLRDPASDPNPGDLIERIDILFAEE